MSLNSFESYLWYYICLYTYMAYALSNEKAITCSKTYDNKRHTQDTPAHSSEKINAKEDVEEWGIEAVARSPKRVISFATHLKWENWLLGVATFTNKGSCLEKDVKHGTNKKFLCPNIVQIVFIKIKFYIRNGTWQSSQFFTWARPWDMMSLTKKAMLKGFKEIETIPLPRYKQKGGTKICFQFGTWGLGLESQI